MPAHGRHLDGVLDAEPPARNVHLMDSLVAGITIAVVPKPVPVVMEAVARELMLGCGAGPKIVVHALRHWLDRCVTDGVAPVEAQSTRQVHITNNAFAQLLNPLAHRGVRTAVGAVLHDAI